MPHNERAIPKETVDEYWNWNWITTIFVFLTVGTAEASSHRMASAPVPVEIMLAKCLAPCWDQVSAC